MSADGRGGIRKRDRNKKGIIQRFNKHRTRKGATNNEGGEGRVSRTVIDPQLKKTTTTEGEKKRKRGNKA